jgi:hypothetical protein
MGSSSNGFSQIPPARRNRPELLPTDSLWTVSATTVTIAVRVRHVLSSWLSYDGHDSGSRQPRQRPYGRRTTATTGARVVLLRLSCLSWQRPSRDYPSAIAPADFHAIGESGINRFDDDPMSQIRSRTPFKAFPGPKSTPAPKGRSRESSVGPFLLTADSSNLSQRHDSHGSHDSRSEGAAGSTTATTAEARTSAAQSGLRLGRPNAEF